MRDLKFRLLRDGKIVGYERHRRIKSFFLIIEHSIDNKVWHPIKMILRYIVHDDKEQYIGREDSKNVEIYEGDKLVTSNNNPEYDLWDKECHGVTVVIWDKYYCCFTGTPWKWDNYEESVYSLKFVEIIGDIHNT